jgi:hypothetical protein
VNKHAQVTTAEDEGQQALGDSNLNLKLSLRPLGVGSGKAPPSDRSDGYYLAPVRCRCYLSLFHSRRTCTLPIKCMACLEWGHVAASYVSRWRDLQQLMKGRLLDNFAK